MSDAVRYRVRHETVYSYGGDVAHSHQLLHLSPRNALRQICHARTITLMPQPAIRSDERWTS
jgi:transglutaminase-like putative cysteine protease